MQVDYLLEVYKEFAIKQGLPPYNYRTYLAYMISSLAQLSGWFSKSGDDILDSFLNAVHSLGNIYEQTDKYDDKSEIVTETVPQLMISQLVDIFLQFLIFVSLNDWEELFLEELNKKLIQDQMHRAGYPSRFKKKRFNL